MKREELQMARIRKKMALQRYETSPIEKSVFYTSQTSLVPIMVVRLMVTVLPV